MTTNGMPVIGIYASATVLNFDAALVWYEALMGRPADDQPIPGMAQWRNMGTAGLQLWLDEPRAGKGLITIVVPDLAAEKSRLSALGMQLINEAKGHFGAVGQIFDAEGNRINLSEAPKQPK
ncbi:VOC family protein [Mesorhizobium sp. B3-2-1]|uniref:VOC family protein n=1 Tax=Mesorhizobium sp. B3-2-1 TaxID=2589891 RepID=UPI00112E4EF3|nr:VOC family protein [Mesorhizobium sp. B3-2-1]TPI30692.1 VOC family protein [Mesorhizobium sp. B3-2-1]